MQVLFSRVSTEWVVIMSIENQLFLPSAWKAREWFFSSSNLGYLSLVTFSFKIEPCCSLTAWKCSFQIVVKNSKEKNQNFQKIKIKFTWIAEGSCKTSVLLVESVQNLLSFFRCSSVFIVVLKILPLLRFSGRELLQDPLEFGPALTGVLHPAGHHASHVPQLLRQSSDPMVSPLVSGGAERRGRAGH